MCEISRKLLVPKESRLSTIPFLLMMKRVKKRTPYYLLDLSNSVRFGVQAPRYAQRILVDPRALSHYIQSGPGRSSTGRVLDGAWDLDVDRVCDHPKIMVCVEHFVNGKSWQDSGAIELMSNLIKEMPGADSCWNLDDMKHRYRKLDEVFQTVKREGRLRPQSELRPTAFRELGGVYVHIDRHAQPIFGSAGWHRLAIAQILQLKRIPAQLGAVHRHAINDWKSNVVFPGQSGDSQ